MADVALSERAELEQSVAVVSLEKAAVELAAAKRPGPTTKIRLETNLLTHKLNATS